MGRSADVALRRANGIVDGVRREREAARAARQRPSKGPWAVMRIHDDGRSEVAKSGLSCEAAATEAGRRRDRMSDAEVGEGWNYVDKRLGNTGQPARSSGRGR